MLSPKHERYRMRMQVLIEQAGYLKMDPQLIEGVEVVRNAGSAKAWAISAKTVVENLVGRESRYFRELERVLGGKGAANLYLIEHLVVAEGVLQAAVADLTSGVLVDEELRIASEVFDSVLQEAKYLNESGHKDASAVLGRVVVEDALKRLARQEGIVEEKKASVLNDKLKGSGRYVQAQWRQIQAWLDIGNDAAHGRFESYDAAMVGAMLDGIEGFLARELRV